MANKARVQNGKQAASTMKRLYGSDYFVRIGRKGGLRTDTRPKGFEANRSLARVAGARGGRASHPTKTK